MDRVLALPSFRTLAAIEDRLIRTPLPEQRTMLADMGVTLTTESWVTTTPRAGVMQT